MSRLEINWRVMLVAAIGLLTGCHGDPSVRKLKYLESGTRYKSEGRYNEAAIQYRNALKVDENFADAHYDLALTYEQLDQYNAAYSELSRTVALQPSNIQARVDLGNLLVAGGKLDDAHTQAEAILARRPDNPDAHAMLSAIAIRRGQKKEALEEIERAIAIDPGRALFHDASALLQSGDPANSPAVEEELKKSIALDPKSVNAKLLLAGFYAKTAQWPLAENVGWSAIATNPRNLSARETLAGVFLKEGKQARAEDVLRQASNDFADDPRGARLLADYYTTSGQPAKAKDEFARLIADHSKDVSLREGYIRALLETRNFTDAQAAVTALMKTNGKDPGVAALNGIVLLNRGNVNEAVADLKDAEKESPDDAFLQYWLGKAALAQGDYVQAEKSFDRSADLDPSRLDAEEETARFASMRGDTDSLLAIANRTIGAAPRFSAAYVWRAAAETAHSSPDQAEADLKAAIGIDPKNSQAYFQLGKLRFAQKRYSEGESLLENALQCDPGSVEAMRLLVGYDVYQKKTQAAMERLNQQIAKSPKASGYYVLLSRLQMSQGRLDQAFSAAEKAVQLNSSDGEAVALYTHLQLQRGQADRAIATWQQWLNTHPNDAGAMAILGTLEESCGDEPKAIAFYKRSLQKEPQQPLAANNLAYQMLENGGNLDVALTLAQTARRGMRNSASTADTLAWAYYYKGAYSFARDLLEDAIKTDPDDATMQYHLGMVYNKLKEKDRAVLHLKRAMSLAPNSHIATVAKDALQTAG